MARLKISLGLMLDTLKEYTSHSNVATSKTIVIHKGDLQEIIGDKYIYYDLASLTKIFCGILTIRLIESNKLDLDSKINNYLNYDYDITIYQLLTHTSGLTDDMLNIINRKPVITGHISNQNIINYADVNYILLSEIIWTFGDYCELMKEYVTRELEITYNPPKKKCVPSEIKVKRGLVVGEVHDNKAFLLARASGHAGLFANANSLLIFFNRLMENKIIDLQTVSKYLVQYNKISRNLLFEQSTQRKQMGAYETKAWFHSGFTGTSVLIDKPEKHFIIILTNRTYPSRKNQLIFDFRKNVHNYFSQI